jgi:hypothetical protein
MKTPHRRFSFPAIAAAILAVVLLTVIAAHSKNASEGHTTATAQR